MSKESARDTEGIPLGYAFNNLKFWLNNWTKGLKTIGCHLYPDTSTPCFPSSNFRF